jgi:SpoVK/Ycf46/Vps4 family AAA+-type ATPase
MDGYFKETQKRFFFFYGQIDDEFCLPNLKIVNFEEVLNRYLKSIGYQVIVLYDGRQGLRYADTQSKELSRPKNQNISTKSDRKKSRIPLGPRNQTMILNQGKENNAQQTVFSNSENNKDLVLAGVNDLHVINYVNSFMKKQDIKTAIIFNGTDFINYFNSQRQINHVLEECSHLSALNENIIIFKFTGINAATILRMLENSRDWAFLSSQMFSGNPPRPSSQMIAISSPREDEIRSLLNYYRIVKELPIDWLSFPQAITQISRTVCGRSSEEEKKEKRQKGELTIESLKDLNANLKNEQALTKTLFAKLAGQLEQRPAFERLKEKKGLEIVAERLEKLINRQKEELERKDKTAIVKKHSTIDRLSPMQNSPGKGINLHIALKGNPGTGKTISAKLIGEIYRDAGLLPLGHTVKASRDDLVAGFVGQTALKTAQKIADAMGGVLFIDEAYTLVKGGENDFGLEAIETIMEAMTNHMGEFAVIIAGYPNKIEHFLDANPGLRRRFGRLNTITIPDYDPVTLQYIFEQKVKTEGRQIDSDLHKKLPFLFENIYAERNEESFGNAGDIENLYQEIDELRSERVMKPPKSNNKMLIVEDDIPEDKRQFLTSRQPEDLDSILNELDHLIGLKEVKDTIRSFIKRIRVGKKKAKITGNGDTNTQFIPGHYLFLGNPGTGKTTVARLMGKIFKNLGLLEKGNVIEVGRADLVGGYQGQSALKTKEVLERSFDNILFIDEAYQMVRDQHDTFGREAFDTLVADMENYRDRLCIILAGYPKPMDDLLKSNPGLTSRFSNRINFSNYNAKEMLEIFLGMSRKESLILAEGVEEKLMTIFNIWETNQSPDFGNGRDVRNLFDAINTNKDSRIDELDESELISNPDLFNIIELSDIPDITQDKK